MYGNNDAGHQHIRTPADDSVRPVFAVTDKQRLNKQQHKPGGKQQPMHMLNKGYIGERREQPEIGFEKSQKNDAENNNKQQADVFVSGFHGA